MVAPTWDNPQMRRQVLILAILLVAFYAAGPAETLGGLVFVGGFLQAVDYLLPWMRGEPLLKSQHTRLDGGSVKPAQPNRDEELRPRDRPTVALPTRGRVRTAQPSTA
jgi:hypothetical protein